MPGLVLVVRLVASAAAARITAFFTDGGRGTGHVGAFPRGR
jgi:hypothetical protein